MAATGTATINDEAAHLTTDDQRHHYRGMELNAITLSLEQ